MIGVEAYENWNFNPRSREGSDLSENVYKLLKLPTPKQGFAP